MSKSKTPTNNGTAGYEALAQRYARQLEIIEEINQIISLTEQTESALLTALEHVLHALDYPAAQIYRLSPTGSELWLYLELGPGTKPVTQNKDIFSIDESNIISDTARRREPIYLPNISQGPYSYYSDNTDSQIRSEIAIPLEHRSPSQQELLGVLRLQSNELDGFGQADRSFFSSLASLFASTIRNTQTVQQLQNDLQEIRILYNLQRQEDLSRPSPVKGMKSPVGYQYEGQNITRLVDIPPATRLVMVKNQDAVVSIDEGQRKEIITPIKLHGETIGVLGIEGCSDGTEWSDEDISLLEETSSQVALAIENSRLLQQTQKRTRELSILFETSRKLSETIELDRIFQILTTQIINYLNANICRVLLLNTARTHFEATISQYRNKIGEIVDDNTPWVHAVEDFVPLQQLLKQPGVIIKHLDDARLEPTIRQYLETHPENKIHSLALFPLVVRNNLLGILQVSHFDQRHNYSQNELQLTQAIISQVNVAIENAQLFQQTEAALSETQKLYTASRSLVESTSAEETFDVVLETIKSYNVDRVSISLLETTTSGEIEAVKIVASWDSESERILPVGSKISANMFSLVNTFARPPFHPLVSEDLSKPEGQDERMDEAFRLFMYEGLGAVTLFSTPMFLGTEYKGVLSISTRRPHSYTEQEIHVYQTLADQTIVAIENHRLFEDTQQNLFYSEVLSHLSQELLAVDKVQAIYDLSLEAIATTGPERGAAIFIYDEIEGGVELEMVAMWDNPTTPAGIEAWPDAMLGARFSRQELDLQPLLSTGQTVVVKKAIEDERLSEPLRQLLTLMQINSLVAVPIWRSREVNGLILIGNYNPSDFSADVIRLYEDIARQTSVALENYRLLEEARHRATLLQTAAEVSQAATTYLNLDTLLSQTVDLIRDRFGYYHVSIFLIDEYQKYAVVEASTGQIGRKMLAMKHKLEVGGRSIVGTATGTGRPRIALDVGEDAVWFNNPLLPDTHSEMALPLIARGEVIGALDVQSTKRGAFTESDITILQSMANQLANAIEAARSFQESQKALGDVRKLHEYYLREQWGVFLQEQKTTTSYRLTEDGNVETSEEIWWPEINQAIEANQPIIVSPPLSYPSNGDEWIATSEMGQEANTAHIEKTNHPQEAEPSKAATLIAPLSLQNDVVIGALDFELPDQEKLWEEEYLKVIEAVASQASQAIEAARLFEQTQAAREAAEALYKVGRALVTADSEQDMFHTVLAELLSTLGLKQGGILFFEEDRKFGRLFALFENGKPAQPGLRFPIEGNPSYERLIETKQPLPIEDVANDPLVATVKDINLERGIASLLLVPIIINDDVVGAMGADSVGEKHVFTESEINLTRAMADQLSIMLQNRRLHEETHRGAVQLQTSADVGRVATSILDQDVMLGEAVELIRDRFGFYHVQIFLIDQKKQHVILNKSTGIIGQKLLNMDHKVTINSQNVIGQAAYRRRPVVIRNVDPNTRQPIDDLDVPEQHKVFLPDTQAELAIPLQVGDTLIGVLDVHSTSPNAFTDADIATMEILGAQLAIATQNARAFREQQETAERLKEMDKLKTQFLANMSHELRTPLNSIIGFSRVILKGIDGPLTDLQKADLTSIHNSGYHLLGLINNMLDVAKIEAGKMELNIEEIEIEPIIKSVMSTARALVKDKPVELVQETSADLGIVWADPTRIRQIILNLVSNACKFTEGGTITLRAYTDEEKLTVSVSDTGCGIPQDRLGNIFEEFTQVDASTTRKVGGTGLGLPISRHFVEMHKGQIWVESVIGRGSTFSFFIPRTQTTEEEGEISEISIPNGEQSLAGQDKVIVAIDDDPNVVNLYQRFLEKQGYTVVGITSSKDVIPEIKEHNPSAILLDVLMPEKDGWGVLTELKDDTSTKDIPVVICSIVSDKNRGFSLGAADYLTKPIVENELVNAIRHLDNQNKTQVKVLVVDDEADDVLLIRRILEAEPNYSILEASNGKEALKLVESHSPDLIILDLTMPEMDGFAVVEKLKNNGETRAIPIIIVSAKELTLQERNFLTGQVEVLLQKGLFNESELLEDVSQALRQIHQQLKIN